ncbi:hypothetical protein WG908_06255 [Sphingobium sp. AN641]|uniref:hypothetical protein n=1 Tax=Sphingobium sp. AN641 TaxID=3133443 RepID=UPI0030C48FF7
MAGAAKPQPARALATPRQYQIEERANAILRTPRMQKTMEEARRMLLATPPASSEAARRTLQQMVTETAGFATLTAASVDPRNPGLVWNIAGSKKWMGHSAPASRFAFDNPDNVYRYAIIDDASTYVLDAQSNGTAGRLTVTVYKAFVGAQTTNWERAVASADEQRIRFDSIGKARITIGPVDPHDGSLYLNSGGGRMLLVREAIYDWGKQHPRTISLQRVSGPKTRSRTFDESVAIAQDYLIAATQTVIDQERTYSPLPINGFASVARGFGKSMISMGRFHIANDEALVVNIRSQSADYIGTTVTSPWLITRDYIDHSGSRTNRQSHQNPNGSYTYIVSSQDPGVANWLDTGGLLDGGMTLRWEGMNAPEAKLDDAITSVKLVKLTALRAELPSGFPSISATDRQAEMVARRRNYETRCGIPCRIEAGSEGN